MNKYVKYLQEGGPMGAPQAPQEPAAPQGGGQDPMAMIVEGAMQAVQTGNPDMAMQVCQMIVEMVGGGQGAPAQEPAPAFKKGGKLKTKKGQMKAKKEMPMMGKSPAYKYGSEMKK